MLDITATIVLYKNNLEILKGAIDSFLGTDLKKKLFLVDNSPTDDLRVYFEDNPHIEYIYNNDNLGFGKGHNKVIDLIHNKSKYHLVLNPDVRFSANILTELIEYFRAKDQVGVISPQIIFENGDIQSSSIRRSPSFFDLFVRRSLLNKIFKNRIDYTEYADKDKSKVLSVDFISGCFQLFDTKVFTKIGGFDPRYFMYMEDFDICRKVKNNNHTVIYYPLVKAIHDYERGSTKSFRLFLYLLVSGFKYARKWNSFI